MVRSHKERLAAERFARFREKPEVKDVAIRYNDWSGTSHGLNISLQLSLLVRARLNHQMSQSQYYRSLSELAAVSKLPVNDFRIIVASTFEAMRYLSVCGAQIGCAGADWVNELDL